MPAHFYEPAEIFNSGNYQIHDDDTDLDCKQQNNGVVMESSMTSPPASLRNVADTFTTRQ